MKEPSSNPRKKENANAPCSFVQWNEAAQSDELHWPHVLCALDCDHCGWNPAVKERRLERLRKNKDRRE